MLSDPAVEMISITAPNRLHAQITIDAARAGKHVVCEKPLCVTLEEADAMIDACAKAGVLLLYAEELFFAPKYVKAKQMADEGAFGRVHLVKQGEKHSGPHSDWFWDVEQSGGGALMDLGCHGIAFCWWFLGKQKVKSVYAQLSTQVNSKRTKGEDEALTIIEFENGAIGLVESSWNRPGGMDDSIEVFGDKGQTYADMLMGNALPTYSEVGFGYAVEKASSTKGWTYPVFEEHWNYGFPPGDAALRAVRAREGEADLGRRDGARRAGSSLRGLRVGGAGTENHAPLPSEGNRQANRPLEKAGAGASGTLMRLAGAIDIGGSAIKIGIVASDGTVLTRERVPMTMLGEPIPVVDSIVAAIRPMLDATSAKRNRWQALAFPWRAFSTPDAPR